MLWQELHTNQGVSKVGFDDEGFSFLRPVDRDLSHACYILYLAGLRNRSMFWVYPLRRVWQELHMNQEASLVDFDNEGLSATVQFYSEDMQEGSMTTYLTRGMVSIYHSCWVSDIKLS